jgi:ACS family allantoate permease-like MFS transporter
MSSDKDILQSTTGTRDIFEGLVLDPAIDSKADAAAAYANRLDGEGAYTNEEATRLRWKLDLQLVPILFFNITLSAMDKVTTSTAALYGMKFATNLTDDRYSWVGSAFYIRFSF